MEHHHHNPTPGLPVPHPFSMDRTDDAELFQLISPLLTMERTQFTRYVEQNVSNKQQRRRVLSMHALVNLFEPHKDVYMKKEEAYKDFKLFFEKLYPGELLVGYPQFGKLMKTVFRCTTRRFGSRVVSKYCFSGVRMRQDKLEWFQAQRPKLSPKITFVDDDMRFHTIVNPLFTTVDKVLLQFLYNETMDFTLLDIEDKRVDYMMAILAKSDMLFKNFTSITAQEEVLDRLFMDWYVADLPSVISTTMPMNDDARQFISTFPIILDPHTQPNIAYGKKSQLKKYLKFDYAESSANPQKLKIINFLLELILKFPKTKLPQFILHFKYTTTSVLRHLTLQKLQSFSSYWILGCFLDELLQFLVEYYAFRVDPTRELTHFKRIPPPEKDTDDYPSE